jgi:hypothetical protein
MKKSILSATFLALFAVACAPVSSSVPKGPGNQNRDKTSGPVKGSNSRILSRSESQDAEEDVNRKYLLLRLTEDQVSELLETRELSVKLGVSSDKVDVDVLISLDVKTVQTELIEKFKMDVIRKADGDFLISVPKGPKAEEAWAYIKKNDPRISIAYRDRLETR